MRLNYILQDLFRDTPLDHIWSAQICIFGQGTRVLKIGVKIQKKLHQPSPHPNADFNDDDDDVHHQHV